MPFSELEKSCRGRVINKGPNVHEEELLGVETGAGGRYE